MIDVDLRRSIVALQSNGMGIREISRRLGIARNTVKSILADGGKANLTTRRDNIVIDEETLAKLHHDCKGGKSGSGRN